MFARRVGRGVTRAISVVRARSLCAAAGGNNLLGPEEAREFAAILIEARRQGKTVVLPEDANGMTVDDGYATQVQCHRRAKVPASQATYKGGADADPPGWCSILCSVPNVPREKRSVLD